MTNTRSMTDALTRWFQGNGYAVRLALDIWSVIQVWDDLVDKDSEVGSDEINETFRKLIYTIPSNPFYAEHAHEFAPILHDMMIRWQIANTLEEEQSDGDLEKAWMLRAGVYQVFVYIASKAVDPVWAAIVGPEIWRSYGETLPDFIAEMEGESDA